jgi:hypothetical protein
LRGAAGYRVAAEKRYAVVLEDLDEAHLEVEVVFAEHVAEQHAERIGALGGKVGEIRRDELPGDVGTRLRRRKCTPSTSMSCVRTSVSEPTSSTRCIVERSRAAG